MDVRLTTYSISTTPYQEQKADAGQFILEVIFFGSEATLQTTNLFVRKSFKYPFPSFFSPNICKTYLLVILLGEIGLLH